MRERPPRVGVYALVIQGPRKMTIRIGRLGRVEFTRGVYVYIGSALNSLEGRVSRHFRKMKRKHWHIDYLLGRSGVRLIGVSTRPTVRRLECTMSRAVQGRSLSSIRGFGCSDCSCDSHLHYLKNIQLASRVLSDVGVIRSSEG